ncbi:ACT domain-containing protein [Parvularcula sp. LCG005]|uniref:ACT domain-containing protein n=1 Tax=Parvularcula sp. LCG005 TaxID=3078805 RepID=UPI0029426BC2|nr:ACT domain-containing protein [Parvularcula sp. LCG005]WOI53113.1 ACT domain-containing protein [Parvularcula sp. LCG005]
MTIETLTIESDDVNGTLRRIWTIIEQRGWYVRSLLVEEIEGGVTTRVQVSPYGSTRSIETLRLQIERLVNVRYVRLERRSREQPSQWKEIPHATVI